MKVARRIDTSLGVLLVVCAAACGGGNQSASGAKTASTPAAAGSAGGTASSGTGASPAVPGHLRRRDITAGLSGGLGAFLGRLEVEPARSQSGAFRGWRILALHGDPSAWNGVDIRPGDVVTQVNGMPIEHPEEAMACWQSMVIAKELRIAIERGGQAQTLVYPIDEEPSAAKSSAK